MAAVKPEWHELMVILLRQITTGELIHAIAVFVNLYIFHIGCT